MSLYATRQAALGKILAEDGLSAYLAHHPVSVSYLTGYDENPGERFFALALHPTAPMHLICPALSVNQAQRAGITALDALKDGDNPEPVVRALAERAGWSGKIAVDDEMPAALLLKLQAMLPEITFVSGSTSLAKLMRAKDEAELAALTKAGEIADQTFEAIKGELKIGMTELEIARRLGELMAERGGVPTFGIVGISAGGAEPHHHNGDAALSHGDILLMDFGCTYGGYFSDITRMVSIGEPSDPEADKVYDVVYRAHMAARALIKPGVTAGELDAAAREVIEEAGYGELFSHRTGHGVGRKIHEDPYIMPGSSEPLFVGDCFSIEPGIYLAGRFGVRIENLVTVTPEGHRSFNIDPSPTLERVVL